MKTWKNLSATYLAVTEEEIPETPRSVWWRLGAAAALAGVALIGCGGNDTSGLTAAQQAGDEDGDGADDTATATATGAQTATATDTDTGTDSATGNTNTQASIDDTVGTDEGGDTTDAVKAV